MKLIDFPGLSVPCTGARWVNQRRDIVGFFSYVEKAEDCGELPSHGFLLRNRRYQKIDFPGSAETKVLAINDDGVIVGNFTDSQGNTHGFKAVPKD